MGLTAAKETVSKCQKDCIVAKHYPMAQAVYWQDEVKVMLYKDFPK
jgi:hypothetical protein